jgi:transposase
LGIAVSAGQAHESRFFLSVLEDSRLPPTRRRARYRPDRLAADKAYNVESIRDWLWRRGIEPVIPRRVPETAPDEPFDREAYRGRNIVERLICWLKECRRVFSRFDKLAVSYVAFLKLAILQRLLKFDYSNRP